MASNQIKRPVTKKMASKQTKMVKNPKRVSKQTKKEKKQKKLQETRKKWAVAQFLTTGSRLSEILHAYCMVLYGLLETSERTMGNRGRGSRA